MLYRICNFGNLRYKKCKARVFVKATVLNMSAAIEFKINCLEILKWNIVYFYYVAVKKHPGKSEVL